jgi:rfaE bifunctional protein nucleotidyltransferase chain/domain
MITPKNWGFEDEIVNREYCGKRMIVYEKHRCSIHKHVKKDEVLMTASGLLWFEYGSTPEKMTGVWLRENERIHVAPETWHRFTALRDTVIMEFSTHHEDSDSIRHVTGGKLSEDEFRSLVLSFYRHENREIVLGIEQAKLVAESLRNDGRLIGLCNGCFDLMHLGHVELLSQAKNRCEVLFVAVNSDESVKALKGQARPFVNETGRTGLVASNRFVDYVVQASAPTCVNIVQAVRPHVYVTTSEHGNSGPEAKEVLKLGGTVEVIDVIKGFNTTALAATIATKR